MWNEDIKPLREDCLFWHRVWSDAGKPPVGTLGSIMRGTRAKYHRAVDMHKKNALDLRRSMIAIAADEKGGRNLWKEIKKIELKGNIPRISSYTWLFAKNTGWFVVLRSNP